MGVSRTCNGLTPFPPLGECLQCREAAPLWKNARPGMLLLLLLLLLLLTYKLREVCVEAPDRVLGNLLPGWRQHGGQTSIGIVRLVPGEMLSLQSTDTREAPTNLA